MHTKLLFPLQMQRIKHTPQRVALRVLRTRRADGQPPSPLPLSLPSFPFLNPIPVILPYQRQPPQTVECMFCLCVWWFENTYTTSLISLSSKGEA